MTLTIPPVVQLSNGQSLEEAVPSHYILWKINNGFNQQPDLINQNPFAYVNATMYFSRYCQYFDQLEILILHSTSNLTEAIRTENPTKPKPWNYPLYMLEERMGIYSPHTNNWHRHDLSKKLIKQLNQQLDRDIQKWCV